MTIAMSIPLSPKQAGALYQKAIRLEEENKHLKQLVKDASDYLDTNNQTSISHGSILHKQFKDALGPGAGKEGS